MTECPCVTAGCREDAMVVLRRDDNGKPTVWCDPCIADLVDAVNAGGLSTVASCCGHGVRAGSIVLTDGRELAIDRLRDIAPSGDVGDET